MSEAPGTTVEVQDMDSANPELVDVHMGPDAMREIGRRAMDETGKKLLADAREHPPIREIDHDSGLVMTPGDLAERAGNPEAFPAKTRHKS